MVILLVAILTVLLIALVPVKYYVNLDVEGKEKWEVCLKVSVGGLIFKREVFHIPNNKSKKKWNWQSLDSISFLKAIRIKKISCYIKYGFNDPFVTGITAGLMWNVLAFAFVILSLFFTIDGSDLCIDLRPDFSGYKPFELHFESIMSMRIGHIITAGLSMWGSRFKQKIRGSERTWMDILLKT
ncbi:hypothetical protein AN618_24070 [Fervidicola ferrireducens]|uniref:DUF2953 domain-containing protein n=1 Tax=Fervidicola ferrireducens TaxID=520764 RepID=A0A140L0Q7_9FIRM|nr:DUF2953 domain-containing protein [Fervidicola ferrireducens]KXG74132.1 hypothetical protein AN618_24070 [Fervidicola ferrireducens]